MPLFWGMLVKSLKGHFALKKLRTVLAEADDAGFFQLIWATYILQSDEPKYAYPYIKEFPPEAATEDFTANFAIRKWELEILSTLLLTTDKAGFKHGRKRVTLIDRWNSISAAVNHLRAVTGAESVRKYDRQSLEWEMARAVQQQFHWSRIMHPDNLHRNLTVYGHRAAREAFLAKYGVSFDDFTMVCMMLSFDVLYRPWWKEPGWQQLKDKLPVVEKVLAVIAIPIGDARKASAELIKKHGSKRISFLPSILREHPVLFHQAQGTYIAPIPLLLVARMTTGLYYDFTDAPQAVRDQTTREFEQYTRRMIEAYLGLETLAEHKYGVKKGEQKDTPDVLVRDGGEITLVFECKTAKQTFEAKFADDPIAASEKAIPQLAKGILQLWRFFSACRRGVYTGNPVAANARGVVLTMDTWFHLEHTTLRAEVMRRAHEQAKQEPDIEQADFDRAVVFSTAQDLSAILGCCDVAGLYQAVEASAREPKYEGYELYGVAGELGVRGDQKQFPFDQDEVIPWRKDLPVT